MSNDPNIPSGPDANEPTRPIAQQGPDTTGTQPMPQGGPSGGATQPLGSGAGMPQGQWGGSVPQASGQGWQGGPPQGWQQGAPAQQGTGTGAAPGGTGTRRGRKVPALAIAGIVGVLALGGGAAFAWSKLGGGGTQPSDVMPGSTFLYARLDIDPSAGQKISAVRFFNSLPQDTKNAVSNTDFRKSMVESMLKDGGQCAAGMTYDKDFQPWLGDRVGVGVTPGGSAGYMPILAVQATDSAMGKATIDKLAQCSGDMETLVKEDYVLMTTKGDSGALTQEIDKGRLSSSKNFSADMNDLGDQGVASMWVDFNAAKGFMKDVAGAADTGTSSSSTSTLTSTAPSAEELEKINGRVAAAVRFDPDYAEVAGITRGVSGTHVPGGQSQLASLPDDTMIAAQISNGGQIIDQSWPQIESLIKSSAEPGTDPLGDLKAQGINLPDDAKALAGKALVFAMPTQSLSSPPGSSVEPKAGFKVVSDDPNQTKAAFEKLLKATSSSTGTPMNDLTKVDGGAFYATSTQDYLDTLSKGGKLGDTDAYKKAIPNDKDLSFGAFVDVEKILSQNPVNESSEGAAFVKSIKAVGIAGTTKQNGDGSFTLRVVAK